MSANEARLIVGEQAQQGYVVRHDVRNGETHLYLAVSGDVLRSGVRAKTLPKGIHIEKVTAGAVLKME